MNMRWQSTIHALRLVASFALLGAIVAGIGLGWADRVGDYARIAGALIGAGAGVIVMRSFSLSNPRKHHRTA